MLSFLPPTLRGVLAIMLITLSTLLHFPFVVLLALLKLAIPWRPSRKLMTITLNVVAANWIAFNGLVLDLFHRMKLDVQGLEGLSPRDWYLVTCNHQSWADILIAQKVLLGKIPFLKFFLKQQLIWVPFMGIAWWALDFPFMKRYSKAEIERNPALRGKDLETTRKSCEKFRYTPVSIFNFMEGTRFTPEKHRKQQSEYRHLLKPKAGGAAFVLGAMGDELHTLLNLTIYYPYDRQPGFWDLLCGRIDEVAMVIEKRPIPREFANRDYMNDAEFRDHFQQWVADLWREKDALLDQLEARYGKRPL